MDPITDMFNRIRNAQTALHSTVDIPFSNFKYEIAKILKREKFVEKIEKKGKGIRKTIKINLKYNKKTSTRDDASSEFYKWQKECQEQPIISGLRRISKPGQRIYMPAKKIKSVQGGYGIAIISTPKGLMTNKEAKKQKLGGEVICEVW